MNENTKLPVHDCGHETVPDGLWGRPRRRRVPEPVVMPLPLSERLLRRLRSLPRMVRAAAVCVFAAVCLAVLLPLLIRAGGTSDMPAGAAGDGTETATEVCPDTDTKAAPEAGTAAMPAAEPGATGTDAGTASESEASVVPSTGAETASGAGTEVPPEAGTASSAEPEPRGSDGTETAPAPGGEDVPVPEPLPGTVRRDVSESERGPRYLRNDTDRDPLALPAWVPDESPAVLLVCSQPYAAYADGDGGGTVGVLTEELAALLRAHGLPVVCVSADMTGLSPDDSLADCRARVQALTRYCCRLYGNITLIIDLRRSAETAEGCLLAASGQVDGRPAAQLRVIADARRTDGDGIPAPAAADLDCELALALREALYRRSPTVSRPVLWRASEGLVPSGLCGSPDGPRLLTVEAGAAGNRFSEAEAALPALADALAEVLEGHK